MRRQIATPVALRATSSMARGWPRFASFRRTVPDVAVIDIGLPDMDGYEVARQIRSEPNGQQPILIALTGFGFPEDRKRSREAGFDRHLVKPVAPEDLLHALEDDARPAQDD